MTMNEEKDCIQESLKSCLINMQWTNLSRRENKNYGQQEQNLKCSELPSLYLNLHCPFILNWRLLIITRETTKTWRSTAFRFRQIHIRIANRNNPVLNDTGVISIDNEGSLEIKYGWENTIPLYTVENVTKIFAILQDDGNFVLSGIKTVQIVPGYHGKALIIPQILLQQEWNSDLTEQAKIGFL